METAHGDNAHRENVTKRTKSNQRPGRARRDKKKGRAREGQERRDRHREKHCAWKQRPEIAHMETTEQRG